MVPAPAEAYVSAPGFLRAKAISSLVVLTGSDGRHSRKIPNRVVRQLAEKRGIDGMGADGAHDERVAVRRALGDDVRTDVAAGSRTVVDDDLLAP